jgi:hypothetical protein
MILQGCFLPGAGSQGLNFLSDQGAFEYNNVVDQSGKRLAGAIPSPSPADTEVASIGVWPNGGGKHRFRNAVDVQDPLVTLIDGDHDVIPPGWWKGVR